MSTEKQMYESCLRKNLPYFGDYMCACPGFKRRHLYLDIIVKALVENQPGEFINVLEIGSWAGASATTFAQSLKKHNHGHGVVVSVDPWKPYHTAEQLSDNNQSIREMDRALRQNEIFNLFLHNVSALDNEDIILPMKGTSETVLPRLARDTFQIVYVDGDHGFKSAYRDIATAMPLVAPGGFLCGDDLELQIHQVDAWFTAANSHLDYVRDHQTGCWYHPGVTLAVAEVLGRVSSSEGFWYVQKAQNGWNCLPSSFSVGNEFPEHLEHLVL